jgi:hypothetical protein
VGSSVAILGVDSCNAFEGPGMGVGERGEPEGLMVDCITNVLSLRKCLVEEWVEKFMLECVGDSLTLARAIQRSWR